MKTVITWEGSENAPVIPFDTYLFVSFSGFLNSAIKIDDDTPLDLEELLTAHFDGYKVDITPEMGGSNYAAILTDNRQPHDAVVWRCCNFYVSE